MSKIQKNLAFLCALSLITCSTNQLVFAETNTKTKSQITTKVAKKPTTPVKKPTTPVKKPTTPVKKAPTAVDKLTIENKQLKDKVTQLEKSLKDTNTNVQNNSKIIKSIDISDGITKFEQYVKITLTTTNNEQYKVYCLGSASELKYDAIGKFFHGLVSYSDKEIIKNNIIVLKK